MELDIYNILHYDKVVQSQPLYTDFYTEYDNANANDNANDNENMFSTIDLHVYKMQDARYKYTENKHQTLFFLW